MLTIGQVGRALLVLSIGVIIMTAEWEDEWITKRRHLEPDRRSGDIRNNLQRDRDRIVHSSAFRILQGKTQVFTASWAPQRYSRVTHSIQVSQIGRGIAGLLKDRNNLSLPEELIESACLAHDIGHPPFGHEGETALNKCMNDYGGFEGNAQGLRALDVID